MIKSRFNTERISVKIGLAFSKLGISPNTWTILALIPAVLGFILLGIFHNLPEALFFFLLSGFIDAIDGAVARVTSSVSALGAFLDGIIDRYVEILLYIGLLFFLFNREVFLLPNSFWVCLLIFGALMPTYIRAYADHRKVITEPEDQKRMGGILERTERLTLIYIGMFLGLLFEVIWLVYIIVIVSILANITALQRLYFVVTYVKRK